MHFHNIILVDVTNMNVTYGYFNLCIGSNVQLWQKRNVHSKWSPGLHILNEYVYRLHSSKAIYVLGSKILCHTWQNDHLQYCSKILHFWKIPDAVSNDIQVLWLKFAYLTRAVVLCNRSPGGDHTMRSAFFDNGTDPVPVNDSLLLQILQSLKKDGIGPFFRYSSNCRTSYVLKTSKVSFNMSLPNNDELWVE